MGLLGEAGRVVNRASGGRSGSPADIPRERFTLSWIERCVSGHQPRALHSARRAAVALILRQHLPADALRTGCELLLIRRSDHPEDPWSGHMALPGGRVDAQDCSPLDAARRETLEEVSIDLRQSGRLLGAADDVQAAARGRIIDLAITPFIFALSHPADPRPNEEVQEIHWIDAAQLLDARAASTMSYHFGGQQLDLPCYRVHDRVIWGLTYRMLQVFFEIVGWRRAGLG